MNSADKRTSFRDCTCCNSKDLRNRATALHMRERFVPFLTVEVSYPIDLSGIPTKQWRRVEVRVDKYTANVWKCPLQPSSGAIVPTHWSGMREKIYGVHTRGGSRIFLGGGAPLRSGVTDWWPDVSTCCIRKPQVNSGGGGVRTPCTLPLDPPLHTILICCQLFEFTS